MQTKIPLYLGKDIKSNTYYFLANKQGVGRFLKYVTYPYWVGANALADFLDITSSAPEEVLREVNLFIEDKVLFEVVPKSRGKKETVIRREIPKLTPNLEINNVVATKEASQGSQLPTPDINSASALSDSGSRRTRVRKSLPDVPVPASTVGETGGGLESDASPLGEHGIGEHTVSDGTPSVIKRKRRTKAEMEEYRKSLSQQS